MADEIRTQAVTWEVGAENGQCWIRFYTANANPLTIPMDPQAGLEMGTNLAKAAYTARTGKQPDSGLGYLHENLRKAVTEQMRMMLTQRMAVMLNSIREDKSYSNGKLAQTLLDVVLSKIA